MAALYNYEEGREGSHSVMLCKEVGGGGTDIENVPVDIANKYVEHGYQPCEELGTLGVTGYCLNGPASAESPHGLYCSPYQPAWTSDTGAATPMSATPSPYVASMSTAGHPVSSPATLPHVGGGSDVVLAIVAAIVAFLFMELLRRRP